MRSSSNARASTNSHKMPEPGVEQVGRRRARIKSSEAFVAGAGEDSRSPSGRQSMRLLTSSGGVPALYFGSDEESGPVTTTYICRFLTV